ncbi:MAG: GDYXXLXY domain-containing protein, partial [Planctomycetia bacterium]|nr:GDYXXLXY domain-containing protein [Planctomycetia bacterium]
MLKIFAISVQFIILLGMVYYHSQPFCSETEIVVRTRVVDPRDMFRGDYIILRYDFNFINSVEMENIKEELRSEGKCDRLLRGSKIYTVMVKDEENPGLWRMDKMTLFRPTEGVFLTGIYEREGSSHVNYGIGQFYVQEKKGRMYERAKHLNVTVGITPDGRGGVKDVKIVEEVFESGERTGVEEVLESGEKA